jgi:hypothetical protein
VGPNPYVIEPHWADWKLVLEMFVAGVAAGTFLFIALANFASDRIFRTRTVRTERTDRTVRTDRTSVVVDEDVEVAARAGLVPFPLMLLVGLLLVVDLGEPFRFLNIVFRSPGAAERGPLPIMFNLNSPMNWGTYIIMVFGLFATVAFLDALWHRRTFRGLSIVETLSHNPIWLAIGAFFALATGAYSGVLVNVTSQNVWGDTILLGAAYVAFSALSGRDHRGSNGCTTDRGGGPERALLVRRDLRRHRPPHRAQPRARRAGLPAHRRPRIPRGAGLLDRRRRSGHPLPAAHLLAGWSRAGKA